MEIPMIVLVAYSTSLLLINKNISKCRSVVIIYGKSV